MKISSRLFSAVPFISAFAAIAALCPAALAGESETSGSEQDALIARVEAALRAAKERRDRLAEGIEKESAAERAWESGDGRADLGLRGRISGLLSERDRLDREIAAAGAEASKLAEKAESAQIEARNASLRFKTFRKEVQRLARELAERLEGTLLNLENPGTALEARKIADRAGTDNPSEAQACFRELLDLYVEVQQDLSRAGTFEIEISMSAGGGPVGKKKAARLGDMTGFFADPGGGGFILRRRSESAGEGSAFSGEVRGLSSDERAAINAFVDQPDKSCFVPFDVTDGRGIAVAQSESSFGEWFATGGLFMYPLAVLALAIAALALWRSVLLLYRALLSELRSRGVIEAVRAGNVQNARAMVMAFKGPEGKVLSAAFDNFNADRGVLEDAFNEAMLLAQPSFRRGLSLIALGAAVAPMLGLLGTVTGMISTFKSLVIFGASDPANLAGGISEALITTEAGLLIAIPALLFRGLLGAVAESALSKLEVRAMSLIIALRCASSGAWTAPIKTPDAAAGPGSSFQAEPPPPEALLAADRAGGEA